MQCCQAQGELECFEQRHEQRLGSSYVHHISKHAAGGTEANHYREWHSGQLWVDVGNWQDNAIAADRNWVVIM
jgi:hypothetical protein